MGYSKLLALTIVVMLSACDPTATEVTPTVAPTGPAGAENRLANTQWRLKSFGAAGTESAVIEGTTITLKFGADGRAAGSGGCNSYGGDYRAQDDRLSFGSIISTKKACVDEGRMQQEQRYFKALGSAGKFELADDRLTIFYDDGRGALNFVKASSSASAEPSYENLNSPVTLLASHFNAVNRREYERAYRYWETPPGNYEEFARGYADTASVQLIVQPPTFVSGAAGSQYAEVPAVLVARQRDGSERIYSGCYVTRKSNLRPPDIPKEDVWHIYKARVATVSGNAAIPELLAQACRN